MGLNHHRVPGDRCHRWLLQVLYLLSFTKGTKVEVLTFSALEDATRAICTKDNASLAMERQPNYSTLLMKGSG